eukprot:gene1016-1542_t
MSGAKRLIARDLALSTSEVELLVGSLNLISGPGGLLSGRLADLAGRKPTCALACLVTIMGALLMAAAQSFNTLLAGRLITGTGVGCCFHLAPLYIAEIAPKSVRGRLVSCFDLFINVGILMGFISGWALTPSPAEGVDANSTAWRLMLGLGAVPSALILLVLPWLPESPRFLVAVGREQEAWRVLHRIYAPQEAESTMALLQTDDRHNKGLTLGAGLRRVFFPAKGAPRAMLLAGMGCAFWQQATGVEAAVYYTPETLEAAGITDENMLLLATAGVGMVKVLFILLAASLVERQGRVRLMLASTAGIAAAQLCIGVSFSAGRVVWLALFGQCAFMAAFSLGSGPCSFIIASEKDAVGAKDMHENELKALDEITAKYHMSPEDIRREF